MMELTQGQKKAKDLAIKWFKQGREDKQVFYIAGAAGTGKTSLVMSIIEDLGLDLHYEVAFATFTGKASLVLRQKRIPATTIHHLIYRLDTSRSESYPKFKLKKEKELSNYRLFVVDECSMIGNRLWDDLFSFGIPVIILGDINQLPPVGDDSKVATLKPDVILTEILRQDQDNPLIQLSQQVISGKVYLEMGNYGDKVFVMEQDQVSDRLMTEADIILCATNRMRDDLNNYYREHLLHINSDLPVDMDKLICRKNAWGLSIQDRYSLINGLIGYCTQIFRSSSSDPIMYCKFIPEFLFEPEMCDPNHPKYYDKSNFFDELLVDLRPFKIPDATNRQALIKKFNPADQTTKFEFGYAITTHLAQGSEWDSVLCFVERIGNNDFMRKWLYTAITRSSNKLYLAY